MGKPFDIKFLASLFVISGLLGLSDVLFMSTVGEPVLFIVFYIMHLFLALLIWTQRRAFLNPARILSVAFLLITSFQYSNLTPWILFINSMLYFYAIMNLLRSEMKTLFL